MEVLYRGGQIERFDNFYVLMCASRLGYVVWFVGRVTWRGQIGCRDMVAG